MLCTCRNDSAFGRLSPRPLQGFCPWMPLDTSVPRPILLYPPQENTKSSGGGMATGLKTSSCFDRVASILLPFLAAMSPVSATMSRLLATLSLVWTGLNAVGQRQQRIQNSAARVIHSQPVFSRATPLLQNLHWLSTQKSVTYKLCALMFDIVRGSAPSY